MKKAVFLMVLLPLALIFSLNVQAEEQQPADNGQASSSFAGGGTGNIG